MGDRLSPGFRVGHYTHAAGETGCTVILPPARNVCSYDLRGSSPGSRELASLDLERRATEVHGILLTGGSAFGLAAADGAMAWLEEQGIGYHTEIATIPVVPAAVIFDIGASRDHGRPDRAAGYAACEAAVEEPVRVGRVGAGSGATVGKWAGREFRSPGGLGLSVIERDGLSLAALAVVNALGDVIAEDGTGLAGTTAPNPTFRPPPAPTETAAVSNTVLAVVTTNAALDKSQVRFLAARGSDGITKAIRPAHTRYDGDVVFAVAAPPPAGAPAANLDVLGVLAAEAVAAAIRLAVR
ncbi:MAG TPA: P1 family peptidase [Candidatus Dormibacteraeota bacterium]|nr:P1 family peptidase [Candidatus Dormibacteraeota bacterium]